MTDIEEIATVAASAEATRQQRRQQHLERQQENHQQQQTSSSSSSSSPLIIANGGEVASNVHSAVERRGADIPGDATIYVHTFGCGHNFSDSEYMMGMLVAAGYRIATEESVAGAALDDVADAFLINSCTVKNPSEDHFVKLVKRSAATKKPVIVAGCVPAGDPTGAAWRDVSVVGLKQIDRVVEVVQEALRGNTVRLFDGAAAPTAAAAGGGASSVAPSSSSLSTSTSAASALPPLRLPKVRRNKFIEIIPISAGCLSNCTYCKTKHARGDLQSYPPREIVQRVIDSVNEGVRDIYLTSEDSGCYGMDIGTDIVALLEAILRVLEHPSCPHRVMLRLGMTNPPYVLRHLEAIGALLLRDNMYEFVHLPVQSGSDAVLELMQREYTVEDFLRCVRTLRASAPRVTLSTDIIAAAPGEGEPEWLETMRLCREVRFPVLNISRYYPRRGTPMAAMKQITGDVAKRRTREISKFFDEECAGTLVTREMLGQRFAVWLTETAHDKHNLLGHTKQFAQVLVDPAEAGLGDLVEVEVTELRRFCAMGRVTKVMRRAAEVEAMAARAQLLSADAAMRVGEEERAGGDEDSDGRRAASEAVQKSQQPEEDTKQQQQIQLNQLNQQQGEPSSSMFSAQHLVAATVVVGGAVAAFFAWRRYSSTCSSS